MKKNWTSWRKSMNKTKFSFLSWEGATNIIIVKEDIEKIIHQWYYHLYELICTIAVTMLYKKTYVQDIC